jgi:hypothetical protein
MLAITLKRPPQRAHCSISIPNARFKRRAQFMRTSWEVGAAPTAARCLTPVPRPAGVIAARNAACAANTRFQHNVRRSVAVWRFETVPDLSSLGEIEPLHRPPAAGSRSG